MSRLQRRVRHFIRLIALLFELLPFHIIMNNVVIIHARVPHIYGHHCTLLFYMIVQKYIAPPTESKTANLNYAPSRLYFFSANQVILMYI